MDTLLKESEKLGTDTVKGAKEMLARMAIFAQVLGFPFVYQKPSSDDALAPFINAITKKGPAPPRSN